jgi:hypothetical protein
MQTCGIASKRMTKPPEPDPDTAFGEIVLPQMQAIPVFRRRAAMALLWSAPPNPAPPSLGALWCG